MNKRPEKWEIDLIYLSNKLLEVYGGIVRQIDRGEDVVWKGKYPSPLDKAMNDIHDLFEKELKKVSLN